MKRLRWCIFVLATIPLSGCGGAGLPGQAIPQAAPRTDALDALRVLGAVESPDIKVPGEWGVSVEDSVDAEYAATSPMTCSTPTGPACNGFVHNHNFTDSLTITGTDASSSATDTGALSADADPGRLSGSVTATAASASTPDGIVGALGQGSVDLQWIDTFRITSSTLHDGKAVTFKSTLTIATKYAISCDDETAEIYAGVTGAGGKDGSLSYLRECSSGKFVLASTPMLIGTLKTNVGANVTISGFLNLVAAASAGASPLPASLTNKIDSASAKLTLTPITPGAGYKTASGKTY